MTFIPFKFDNGELLSSATLPMPIGVANFPIITALFPFVRYFAVHFVSHSGFVVTCPVYLLALETLIASGVPLVRALLVC